MGFVVLQPACSGELRSEHPITHDIAVTKSYSESFSPLLLGSLFGYESRNWLESESVREEGKTETLVKLQEVIWAERTEVSVCFCLRSC